MRRGQAGPSRGRRAPRDRVPLSARRSPGQGGKTGKCYTLPDLISDRGQPAVGQPSAVRRASSCASALQKPDCPRCGEAAAGSSGARGRRVGHTGVPLPSFGARAAIPGLLTCSRKVWVNGTALSCSTKTGYNDTRHDPSKIYFEVEA